MEETIKKRGRKKIVALNVVTSEIPEEPIKKKRGRKKKWETTPFKNNYNTDGTEPVTFDETNNFNDDLYTYHRGIINNQFYKYYFKVRKQGK